MQLLVGEVSVFLRIITLPKNSGLVATLGEMADDAVVGNVQRAILEPFDRNVVWVVGGVLDLAEGLDPVDALGLLGPEAVRILDRASVATLVIGIVHMVALAPVGCHVIDLFGHRHPSPGTIVSGRRLSP